MSSENALGGLCRIAALRRISTGGWRGAVLSSGWGSRLFLWRLPARGPRNNHRHHSAFHYRRTLDGCYSLQLFCDAIQQLPTNVRVAHIRTTKLHADSYFIPLGQKLLDFACFYFNIMIVGTRTHTNLFERNRLLMFTRLIFFLGLLVFISPIIH